MRSVHHASLNQLWAALLLEELSRRGVRHVCLAPGSRSTPLVMALEQQPELELHHHFDERGLGFLALGLAKGLAASRQSTAPVAIITTSGTAVANLYPAVIEAAQTGIPLVVISADRPPRLHDCGANQAIDQVAIFAGYPRRSLYLPPPSLALAADQLLEQIATALAATSDNDGTGGVCHINCMFDEPLYPGDRQQDFSEYLQPLRGWLDGAQPYPSSQDQVQNPSQSVASDAADSVQPSPEQWQQFAGQPGLVVVAAIADRDCAAAAKALAASLGWPLLADIQSQLKTDPDCLGLTDLLLSDDQARQQLDQPRHLLQFGNRLVSKRLQAFVDHQPWQQFWLVHPGDKPLTPGRNSSHFFPTAVAGWCRRLLQQHPPTVPQHLASNTSLVARQTALAEQLHRQWQPDNQPQLSELAVAYQLLVNSPDRSWLLAGNSLSIRLLDLIGSGHARHEPGFGKPQIFANRGASGIDGLVSTALGCARASELTRHQPGTLLLGDYSLLYDLNALALLRDHPQPLVIVVLNNDGGGIFRLLPVADEALRQRHYQRPHGLNFEQACLMFGIHYEHPATLGDFIDRYRAALTTSGPSLIEISADARATEQQIHALFADRSGAIPAPQAITQA